MKTLVMDTAWKNLVVGLLEDGVLKEGVCMEAFKKQSETLMVKVQELLKNAGWKLKDIDEIVITDGPGSYTGLRIAMTAAKVMAVMADKPLKTISTLELYAGLDPQCNVILDARGHRAYAAHIENGKTTWMGILPVEELPAFLDENPGTLYGEGELAGRPAADSNFLQNFQALLPLAQVCENPDWLVPRYLKESDSYKV